MDILTFLIICALVATIAALGSGIVSMMRGGESDLKHSSHLMWARVGLQGVAFALLVVALAIAAL